MCVSDIPPDIVLRRKKKGKKKGCTVFSSVKKYLYMNKMLFDERVPLKKKIPKKEK